MFPQKFDATQIKSTFTDTQGRLLAIELSIEETEYFIINVYAPTKDHAEDQRDFIIKLHSCLNEHPHERTIIGGDFNICLHPEIDKKGGTKEKQSQNAKQIIELCEQNNLTDAWRVLNPEINRFTRRENTRGGIVQTRIDFWIISECLLNVTAKTDIQIGCKSDHSVISIDLQIHNTNKRGRGFWKFNATLLRNREYINKVKVCIANNIEQYKNFPNKGLVWDVVKCEIRGLTISFSTHLTRTRNQQEKDLATELEDLEKQLDNNSDSNLNDRYKSLKQEFESIQAEKAKGAILRSRAKWTEEGEKNTKFFLDAEKRNYESKYIKMLHTNTSTLQDPKDILEEERRFYKDLYTEPTHRQEYNEDEIAHDFLSNLFLQVLLGRH